MFSPFMYIDFVYDSCVAAVVIKGCHFIDDILFILNTEKSLKYHLFDLKSEVCHFCTTRGTKQNSEDNDCFKTMQNHPTAKFIGQLNNAVTFQDIFKE